MRTLTTARVGSNNPTIWIEKPNRIGKIAFDGDAATAALFNKDLIQRARKQHTAEPA